MNERIQELLEDAGVEVWYDDASGQNVFSGDNVKQLEKFAELIVQKCADIADHCAREHIDWPGDKIKEHFGVDA